MNDGSCVCNTGEVKVACFLVEGVMGLLILILCCGGFGD